MRWLIHVHVYGKSSIWRNYPASKDLWSLSRKIEEMISARMVVRNRI